MSSKKINIYIGALISFLKLNVLSSFKGQMNQNFDFFKIFADVFIKNQINWTLRRIKNLGKDF